MDSSDNKEELTFEKALFLALSANGMLLPTNDEQVKELEKSLGSTKNLPDVFSDATFFSSTGESKTRHLKIDDFENLDAYNLKVASSSDLNESEEPTEK